MGLRADEIRQLFDYSYSATRRVLETARRLSPEEYRGQPGLPGAWSVQKTLVHMLDAELSWREGLKSRSDFTGIELDPGQFPDIETLKNAWETDEAVMREWLDTLDDADLNAELDAGRMLWQYLVHVVNHSTQHRSEVAMLLTGYGHSPGDLDFTWYLRGWPDA
jgi:uncharacterized damage-inducible protein DinB